MNPFDFLRRANVGALAFLNSFKGQIGITDLADGTDGELITWGTSGVPETVGAGTATQVLTSNGAGAVPTFQAPAATGPTVSQIATTSGGSVGITGIAATTKLIRLSLAEVGGTNPTPWDIQLGDSGGYENTGYDFSVAGAVELTNQDGWEVDPIAADAKINGDWWIVNVTGNQWAIFGLHSNHDGSNSFAAVSISGSKTLSGTLSQLQITIDGAGTYNLGLLTLTEYE